MKLCFVGAYNPGYPRNRIIKKGLVLNGVKFSECRLQPKYKFWLRYPLLLSRSPSCLWRSDFFFVPEFCQKDMPLAKMLSVLASKKIIFDPLASRFETKITDWGKKPENSWQARWNFKIDYWAFRLSDLVLADTQAHKDYYCQKYGLSPEKVEVLPVGYDDDLFKPSPPTIPAEKNGVFKVLFYGSFLPLHGVDIIVSAAKITSSKDPSIQFEFVGSGQTLPRAKALAHKLGLSNVYFESWLPQSMLPQKIASANICLGIFGKTEKARRVVPHKIFQSMGVGKPVITFRTPAAEEFFLNRENIFFSKEAEPAYLAQTILELKEDIILREKIAENGHRLVRENFSPKAIGETLVRIIERNFGASSRRIFR